MKIEIDGITYVPVTPQGENPRELLVIDRGWMIAGDVDVEEGNEFTMRLGLPVGDPEAHLVADREIPRLFSEELQRATYARSLTEL